MKPFEICTHYSLVPICWRERVKSHFCTNFTTHFVPLFKDFVEPLFNQARESKTIKYIWKLWRVQLNPRYLKAEFVIMINNLEDVSYIAYSFSQLSPLKVKKSRHCLFVFSAFFTESLNLQILNSWEMLQFVFLKSFILKFFFSVVWII